MRMCMTVSERVEMVGTMAQNPNQPEVCNSSCFCVVNQHGLCESKGMRLHLKIQGFNQITRLKALGKPEATLKMEIEK